MCAARSSTTLLWEPWSPLPAALAPRDCHRQVTYSLRLISKPGRRFTATFSQAHRALSLSHCVLWWPGGCFTNEEILYSSAGDSIPSHLPPGISQCSTDVRLTGITLHAGWSSSRHTSRCRLPAAHPLYTHLGLPQGRLWISSSLGSTPHPGLAACASPSMATSSTPLTAPPEA